MFSSSVNSFLDMIYSLMDFKCVMVRLIGLHSFCNLLSSKCVHLILVYFSEKCNQLPDWIHTSLTSPGINLQQSKMADHKYSTNEKRETFHWRVCSILSKFLNVCMYDQIDINIALNQSTRSHFNAALPYCFIQLNGSDEERRIFNKMLSKKIPQNIFSVIQWISIRDECEIKKNRNHVIWRPILEFTCLPQLLNVWKWNIWSNVQAIQFARSLLHIASHFVRSHYPILSVLCLIWNSLPYFCSTQIWCGLNAHHMWLVFIRHSK